MIKRKNFINDNKTNNIMNDYNNIKIIKQNEKTYYPKNDEVTFSNNNINSDTKYNISKKMIKYSSPNDNNNRIIKESNYKTNLYTNDGIRKNKFDNINNKYNIYNNNIKQCSCSKDKNINNNYNYKSISNCSDLNSNRSMNSISSKKKQNK